MPDMPGNFTEHMRFLENSVNAQCRQRTPSTPLRKQIRPQLRHLVDMLVHDEDFSDEEHIGRESLSPVVDLKELDLGFSRSQQLSGCDVHDLTKSFGLEVFALSRAHYTMAAQNRPASYRKHDKIQETLKKLSMLVLSCTCSEVRLFFSFAPVQNGSLKQQALQLSPGRLSPLATILSLPNI